MKNEKIARERSEYSVQAVTNAIRILEELGESDHEQSTTELCHKLGLTKSNVNKLLATLEMFGYVDNNGYTGNFGLGVKTFQISQAYINKLNLTEVAHPIQKTLRDLVDESVYISVLRKENVVYLSVVETDTPVRVTPRIGNVGPAYATATGKIQLAYLEDREVEQLYGTEFKAYTEHTIKSLDQLHEELIQAKQFGYAMDNEEYEIGVRCIACPVKNFMGQVIAAISVTAPVERMTDNIINDKILPALMQSANMLSTKFGYRG